MARKKFKYKGYTIEELQAMPIDEVVEVMPSRIRRSMKKGFSEQQKKLMAKIRKERKKLDKDNEEEPDPIKTHCRDMPIIPEMVGLEFEIHKGQEFKRISIEPEMLGHILGEFTYNREVVKHSAPGVGATRSSLFVPIR